MSASAERARLYRQRNPNAGRAYREAHREDIRAAAAERRTRPVQVTPEDLRRFWSNVDTSAGLLECWPWVGHRKANGYGQAHVSRRHVYAHRFALELHIGRPLGPGMQARHVVCDNPPCCNPAHLAEGTVQDNSDDMVAHGRAAVGPRNAAQLYPERRPRGERHGNRKLTEAAVREIRVRRADGEQLKSLAAAFGVGDAAISRITTGQQWGHAGGPLTAGRRMG